MLRILPPYTRTMTRSLPSTSSTSSPGSTEGAMPRATSLSPVTRTSQVLHKGPNLAGIDPTTGKLTRLFHPRRHKWSWHFRWDGPRLVGRTAIGRAIVAVLGMNLPHRVALRADLI